MLKPRHRAVVDALLPPAFESGFDAFYADFAREAPLAMRFGFALALETGAWVAPLLIGRMPTLARLPREDAEAALEALGRCRVYFLRQQLLLLKAVLAFHYGADEGARRAAGYPA